MSVIHSWEIDEEIAKLPSMTDARKVHWFLIEWFEVLGRLPMNDFEGRGRVSRLLNAIDGRLAELRPPAAT